MDGDIIDQYMFPSPHPGIEVFVVTYMSQGLKVKGFFAAPKGNGVYDGFLYLRGGIKTSGRCECRASSSSRRADLPSSPRFTAATEAGKGTKISPATIAMTHLPGLSFFAATRSSTRGASICSASRAAGRWRFMPPLWRKTSVQSQFGEG